MANRLDKIKFTQLFGKEVDVYGYQEVDENGDLVNIYYEDGEQIDMYANHEFEFVKTLGKINDSDDFWDLLEQDGVVVNI